MSSHLYQPRPQTRRLFEAGQERPRRPNTAYVNSLEGHCGRRFMRYGPDSEGRVLAMCPGCLGVNRIKDGDRLRCQCGCIIELDGDVYAWWRRPGTVYDKLMKDPDIRRAAEQHENIEQALRELEVLIDLHKNL